MSVRRDIFGEDLILPGLRGTWITYLINYPGTWTVRRRSNTWYQYQVLVVPVLVLR